MKSHLLTALLLVPLATLHAADLLKKDFQDPPAEDLAKGFVQPPDSARPQTWWHWMSGNVTKEGITADLESMARVGIGGATLFNAGESLPHGPIQFNSPEWLGLVKHAAAEARRLGLELGIHNGPGWSNSGGPWNTPEHGMKMVVTSEKQVKGPTRFDGKLAQPPTQLGWYRDISVLAFRTPVGELTPMRDAAFKVTSSAINQGAAKAADGNPGTSAILPLPKPNAPQFMQFEFAQPYTARMLTIQPGLGMQSCGGNIEVSDDGQAFRTVKVFEVVGEREPCTFAFAPVTAKFYRLLFTKANIAEMKQIPIAGVEFSAKIGIENLVGKIYRERRNIRADAGLAVQPEEVVQGDQTVDISAKMTADGQLAWDVPAGDWTILRMGYTPNGRINVSAPTEGFGLECDKLSKEAAQAHWDGGMGKVLSELGPLAGKVKSGLNSVLNDSYEVGTQNWTQNFKQEFQKRCGYDISRFLPVFSGRVVDSPEITERFMWDLRRTISDLFAENYSGQFRDMAHRAGLLYAVEPYGNCPSDDMQYGSYADVPMSEFFVVKGSGNARLASSIGHVYGRKYVGAESFTGQPHDSKWLNDPYSMKAQGDAVYCGGVNRFIFHRFAHQPWTDPARLPGMTMGQWGTHLDRTVTWWEQGKDWMKYLARCQYLLQEGQFVADVCIYGGENAPGGQVGPGDLPPGYDYDSCDRGALSLMSVKDGRIVLPSGMSYRVLVLRSGKTMSPGVLKTIGKLVEAGATVVGPKPEMAPGLIGYPASDAEVKQLADAIWAKGVLDQSSAKALAALKVKPDFVCANPAAQLQYIHRSANGADLYFVSSQKMTSHEVECTFRVSGKVPEFWQPETGVIEKAPVYTEQNGSITVPLRFAPAGSVFVVFREASTSDHAVSVRRTVTQQANAPAEQLAILKAEYGAFGDTLGAECLDVTAVVKRMVKNGNLHIPASNDLAGNPMGDKVKEIQIDFLVKTEKKSLKSDAFIDLPAGAEVIKAVYGVINDTPATERQIVDVTAKLAGLVKDGALSVGVNNDMVGHDLAASMAKELRVEYLYQGQHQKTNARQNTTLTLPGEEAVLLPAYEIFAKKGGSLEIQASQPATFEIATAAGKTLKATVADIPKPLEITGPWELSFPPNWGAPAKVTLDKLISWTEHPDSGVKYFSGTATYLKTFAWDAKKQKSERYILDLGALKNIADVTLNGKSLGLLWKPPYRLDVTGALKTGKNTLQVKITNLWPNRLIGDEQLPADREWGGFWTGKCLKAWPQWLLDGKPSPTGRFTFTTWHHWNKDDEPLPSGLFGPVMIRSVVTVVAQ